MTSELTFFQPPVEHGFSDGLYSRKMLAKKGTFIIGHRHSKGTLNLCLKGRAMVYADGVMYEIKAPWGPYESGPGVRKLAFVLEDVEWLNICPNPDNERNILALEERFTVPDKNHFQLEEDLEAFRKLLQEHAQQLEAKCRLQ